jgi:hypothetical protein
MGEPSPLHACSVAETILVVCRCGTPGCWQAEDAGKYRFQVCCIFLGVLHAACGHAGAWSMFMAAGMLVSLGAGAGHPGVAWCVQH